MDPDVAALSHGIEPWEAHEAQERAQNRTVVDRALSINGAQQRALQALVSGLSREEAAAAAGVRPEQVSRWTHGHPGFRAALAAARMDVLDEVRDTTVDLVRSTLTELARRIDEHDDAAFRMVLDRLPPELFAAALARDTTTPQGQLGWLASMNGMSPEQYAEQAAAGDE